MLLSHKINKITDCMIIIPQTVDFVVLIYRPFENDIVFAFHI